MLTTKMIEQIVRSKLEDHSLEEILELFDIDPLEAFMILFNNGHIDEELLEDTMECG